jgi:cytochrome c oxidase subunit II
MLPNFPLFPQQASTVAASVDALYFFMVAVTAFFSVLIAAAVIIFAIRFRRRAEAEVGHPSHGSLVLELTWTVIPLGIAMVMFVWGATVYFKLAAAPNDAMDVYVIGKRWMWKMQHVTGQKEINELHVPVNQPMKLIIGSEDVIHSFYIPAFRVKMDAVPGRSTTLWFQATKVGEYQLFCAEYCGTSHSKMLGRVVVMEQPDFQAWLGGGRQTGTLAEIGQRLFTEMGCITCHTGDSTARGPQLQGLFGTQVTLANGDQVVADESYIRESLMAPQSKLVAGFPPLMPTYQGRLSEEQIVALIEHIKSMAGRATPGQTAAPGTTTQPAAPAAPAPGTGQAPQR